MADIVTRRLTCIIAGDMNIDLTKCETNCDTAEYIDMLLTNNFMPVLVMPTRITANSATLIDHIYYFDGVSDKNIVTVKSGNLLVDITDHLPGYVLILRKAKEHNADRPMVRIFSPKNINEFVHRLRVTDWSPVTSETDVNISFNKFMSTLSNSFNDCFRLVKLSRRRENDKKNGLLAHLKKVVLLKITCINAGL